MLLVLTATAACAAATTRTCSGPASHRLAELQGQVPHVRAGNRRQARHRGLQVSRHHAGRDVHALRRQAELRRSRRAGQPLSGRATSPASSTGSTWPTCGSRASAGSSAVVETLLPLGSLAARRSRGKPAAGRGAGQSQYEFLPSAESILEEVVPTSFKVKLFKCFLDAAVSEQVARMVAMKAATENADDRSSNLSMAYNRARQSADHRRNHGNHRRRRSAEGIDESNATSTRQQLDGTIATSTFTISNSANHN